MGVKRPEKTSKRRFFGESATWLISKPLPIPFFLGLLFWMKKHQPLSFWGYFG